MSKSQISVRHICLILKLALYKCHIIIIIQICGYHSILVYIYIYIFRLRCTSNTTTCYNTVYLKLHYTILYWKILFEKNLGGCPSKSALVTGPRSHNIDIHSVCHRLEGRPYDSSVIVLLVWFNSLKSRDFSLQSFMSIWWAKTYHEASIKKKNIF